MIEWTLRRMGEAGIREVLCLLNGYAAWDPVEDYLRKREGLPAIEVIRKTTASSFESFRLVSETIARPPFLVTTVDTISPPGAIAACVNAGMRNEDAHMVLGVAEHVDDEKPLWVAVDPSGRITAMGDAVTERSLVTAGVYFVVRSVPREPVPGLRPKALREYLTALVEAGPPVYGWPLKGAIDIDRPCDVEIAEREIRCWAARSEAEET